MTVFCGLTSSDGLQAHPFSGSLLTLAPVAPHTHPTGVAVFNLIEELFAPGRKHTEEERNRLQVTLDEVGDSDPGQGPIDLDSGHVVIRPREG